MRKEILLQEVAIEIEEVIEGVGLDPIATTAAVMVTLRKNALKSTQSLEMVVVVVTSRHHLGKLEVPLDGIRKARKGSQLPPQRQRLGVVVTLRTL